MVLKAQYVISAAKGVSIKAIKTKDVVWWWSEVAWDHVFIDKQPLQPMQNLSNMR